MLRPMLGALRRFLEILDSLDVPYAIGGSFASSHLSVPRATNDVDVLVELEAGQVEPLRRALAPEFYVDEASIRDALAQARSFNVIHLSGVHKIDVFVAGDDRLDREQLERRVRLELAEIGRPVWMTSGEVIVLRKLDWYRRGDGTSERQWRDVLAVLRTQGVRLDRTYMDGVARALGLDSLLRRAWSASGEPG
jgi:hypothetical protein